MSETLQRYREGIEWGAAVMFPHEKGEYVLHADAQHRIEKLEGALRKITEIMEETPEVG